MNIFLSIMTVALIIGGIIFAWNNAMDYAIMMFLIAYVMSNETRFMSIEEKIKKSKVENENI